MTRTTARAAAAVLAAAGIVGATYVAGEAADAHRRRPCREAVALADRLVNLHGRETGTLAAYQIAQDLHLDNEARIRGNLRRIQRTYRATLADYQAAAGRCH